jgi:hypothetical protein
MRVMPCQILLAFLTGHHYNINSIGTQILGQPANAQESIMARNFTNPPKNVTWWIALILGVLGLLGFIGGIAALAPMAFWLVLIGLALLLIACITRGL